MTAIVVAYEDEYCSELHALVRQLRRDQGHDALILEMRRVRGTGNFLRDAPRLLRTPLPQTKARPDRVVCVADADRPGNLVPGAAAAPANGDAATLASWVERLEDAWVERLRNEANLVGEERGRLQAVCLRWSKESVLLGSPESLLQRAGLRRASVEKVFATCSPDPREVAPADFMVRYRKPIACLDQVFAAIRGGTYKKGRDDEDLLKAHIRPDPARRLEVLERCPDLARLVALLRG